jgi:SAM-dependent methyltransferase
LATAVAVPQPVLPPSSDRLMDIFGRFFGKKNLNVGSALRRYPGFINLDCDPQTQPDIVHNMEVTPLPFADNEFDCVFGSHVFEHVHNFVPLVQEFHRILKPGGFLIGITPYMGSDDAWECPHHVRAFNENTWYYFDQRLYGDVSCDSSGYGAWQNYRGNFQVEELALVPYPQFLNDPELDFKKKHWRNVIQEVQAVLRKV